LLTNRQADDDVLLALDLAMLGKQLKVLPRSGGLLDQDYYHILLLKAGLQAMAKKEKRDIEEAKAKNRR